MVEIYQEQLVDLLQKQPELTGDHLIDDQMTKNDDLKIKECSNRGIFVEGLTQAKIWNYAVITDIHRWDPIYFIYYTVSKKSRKIKM